MTTPDGETIGTVQGLLLDEEEGRVTAAIVAVGGFLGFGAKNIAVRWDELQLAYDAPEITLDLTRESAEAAPGFVFRDQEMPLPPPPPADTRCSRTREPRRLRSDTRVPRPAALRH